MIRISVLFNTLSRFGITFLPRDKHPLISWLPSPSMVILVPKNVKYATVSIVFSSIYHEVMGQDVMALVIWMLSFKPAISLFNFNFIKRLFTSSLLSAIQFSSVTQSCLTLRDPMNRSTPGSLSITISWSSLKLTCIESVMPSSHLILCHPLFLLPPIPPNIRVFSSESTLHMRWPKYSALASLLPKNTQGWSSLEWTGWISLQSKGLSKVFSNTIQVWP